MVSVDGSVGWDGHLVLLHHSERERRSGVVAWVRRGLDLGAKILYIEPRQESAERSLMGVLKEHAVDTAEATERGQLQVIPANDGTYSPTWQESVVDEALAGGYPTVRWSGEASTAWSVMSQSVHADIEWATDELCHTRPVSILCQYSSGLTQETLQTVNAMHGDGLREWLLQTFPIPGGIALAGEVDASNAKLLDAALLAAISAAGQESFVVELSGLDFLDCAGARALMAGTTAHRTRGGRVCLRAARDPVDRVLHLLNVDRVPGVRVEGL